MNTLSIRQLTKTYQNGVKALNNISLDIGKGMFGLLGPNGAGKSSLMKTIVGLQKPDSGRIHYNNEDIVKDPGLIKKRVGFLPQDFGVYPKVSAHDLLHHLALLKGVSNKQERNTQVRHLLEKVNLTQQQHKEVHTFSGGMKQRFGVAQALLGNPQIIIVDEPTAGLDPEERNRFNQLLSDISEDIIVMLSTHLVEDVKNLCSHMAIMHKGSLLATGSPSEMTAVLEGRLWTKQIDRAGAAACYARYQVISTRLVERALHITVYAEQPIPGFTVAPPTLEHVYFHTLYR